MKKIKIPNKLSALISKLDIIVSVGIALACVGILIVSSAQFKNSLTDVNSNIEALDTLPYEPSYVTKRDVQTHSTEEIIAAWEGRYSGEVPQKTITEMAARFYMQPHDPGTLADLVVVGTYTGHRKYRYRSFVADVRIDKVLSPLDETSKLEIGGEKKESTYELPSLNLHEGDIIKIYDELTLQTTSNGDREIVKGSSRNPYSYCFPPLRPNGQYLFFLNYSPKADIVNTDTARFKLVPSLYGRIPISNGKTFKPNIFCDNSSEQNTTENNAETAHENSDQQQEDYDEMPKFTYRDAIKFDLFVRSPKVEQLYRDKAAKILQKYL